MNYYVPEANIEWSFELADFLREPGKATTIKLATI
jgi:hypothetical protein